MDFFVKPPNVSATFSKKSLFYLHFMVFCRGKLAENALRNSHRCHRFSQMLLLGKTSTCFRHFLGDKKLIA